MADFGSEVRKLADNYKRRNLAVFRQSAQDLAQEANTPKGQGGKLPLDTGNLRNSQRASLTSMPSESDGVVELVILTANLGDTIYIGWTAAYAMRMEYGFQGPDSLGRVYNQPGNGFARSAAQNWPAIVDRVVAQVKAR